MYDTNVQTVTNIGSMVDLNAVHTATSTYKMWGLAKDDLQKIADALGDGFYVEEVQGDFTGIEYPSKVTSIPKLSFIKNTNWSNNIGFTIYGGTLSSTQPNSQVTITFFDLTTKTPITYSCFNYASSKCNTCQYFNVNENLKMICGFDNYNIRSVIFTTAEDNGNTFPVCIVGYNMSGASTSREICCINLSTGEVIGVFDLSLTWYLTSDLDTLIPIRFDNMSRVKIRNAYNVVYCTSYGIRSFTYDGIVYMSGGAYANTNKCSIFCISNE